MRYLNAPYTSKKTLVKKILAFKKACKSKESQEALITVYLIYLLSTTLKEQSVPTAIVLEYLYGFSKNFTLIIIHRYKPIIA